MAGMLPGVEAARRRRFPQSKFNYSNGSSTRRLSFCLYASNHGSLITSNSSMLLENIKLKNSIMKPSACDDEKLETVAREAKKRLDYRLQNKHHKSKGTEKDTKRSAPEKGTQNAHAPKRFFPFGLGPK